MTDFATTRLILTGPKDELIRFENDCIHPVPQEGCDEDVFDFNVLIPMPCHVRLTMNVTGTAQSVPSVIPTPSTHWYHWRALYWGTKLLPSCFEKQDTAGEVYDCVFDTPWRCPRPVIKALAIAYPKLKGFAVSYVNSDGTGEIGAFTDGIYQVTKIEDDFIYDDPVDCGCTCECDCADEVFPEIHRMISRSYLCWDDLENDVRAALSWAYEQNAVISSV